MSPPTNEFSAEERAVLKEAFLRLIPKSEDLTNSLYAHFFERLPEVRKMFRLPIEEQRDKLVQMMALMMDALDRPREFEEACRVCGERHREYGAKPEHYEPLQGALLDALRETCVPPPTIQEEALWSRLFRYATDVMKPST